jgi:hypothetical protein
MSTPRLCFGSKPTKIHRIFLLQDLDPAQNVDRDPVGEMFTKITSPTRDFFKAEYLKVQYHRLHILDEPGA